MEFNFDQVIQRRDTNSYKWDAAADADILPMWVADMDFRTAPCVIKALEKRVQHGIFGYTKVPNIYFDAVRGWFERRHSFKFDQKSLLFTTGVVPAISAIIKALTQPGDQVIVQTPVYNCFFSSIRNDACELVSNALIYSNGTYSIDFEDLELKTSDPKAKIFLLCNPHNPVGRVWTEEELLQIGQICLRNKVTVVSDEIHCDLVFPGHRYLPFASINKDFLYNSVTCISPSKAFNLAGLQCANILSANDEVRSKINKQLNVNEVCEINTFAIEALISAYTKGEEWLEQLLIYLKDNYNYLSTYLAQYLPGFNILPLEGTYLVWIDCSILGIPSSVICEILYDDHQLWVSEGTIYGEAGEGFIRINIACPKQILVNGLNKLKNAFAQN